VKAALERANNDETNLDSHIYWGSRLLLIDTIASKSDTAIAQGPNIIITQKFDTVTRDSDAAIQNVK
jgi:hypothetical protein